MNVASVKKLLSLCYRMKQLQVSPRVRRKFDGRCCFSGSLLFMSQRHMPIATEMILQK